MAGAPVARPGTIIACHGARSEKISASRRQPHRGTTNGRADPDRQPI